jgi:hypothetical protein
MSQLHAEPEARERQDSSPAAQVQKLAELVRRAEQGDTSVLPALRKALEDDASLWAEYGDLALQAQESWLNLLAGKNLMLLESVRQKMKDLREELGGGKPSPLEMLLVERIVACWLQTHFADTLYAQAKGPNCTPGVLRELMKRQESSQRRYLAAIKQLALVRKLLKPSPSPFDVASRAMREGPPATSRVGRAASRSEPVSAGVPVLN